MDNENKKINYFNFVIEILILIFLFLMPIIFDRRIGIVFSLTKTTTLRILLTAILSVWVIKILIAGKARFIRTKLDWPVLTYLLACSVATITSVHVFTSFVGFYGRYEGLITLYNYALCLFLVTNYIRSNEQIMRLIAVVACAVSPMAIYGIIQRWGIDPYGWGGVVTNERVIGTIGQPNFFAAYLEVAFMLVLVLYFVSKSFDWNKLKGKEAISNWLEQIMIVGYYALVQIVFVVMLFSLDLPDVWLWYFGFSVITFSAILFSFYYTKLAPIFIEGISLFSLGLIYTSLLFTQSRGGYLGFVFGGTLFLLLVSKNVLINNWKKILLLGLLIIVLTSMVSLQPLSRFMGEVDIEKTQSQPGQTSYKLELHGAAGSRIETWRSAFAIIADYPLFGIGPEVLKMIFPKYETDLFRFKEAFHVKQDRCHNSVFDQSVTRGMISFAAYLWIIIAAFYIGIKKINKVGETERIIIAALFAAISSYFVQNQFSFGVVAIGSIFWVCLGLMASVGEKSDSEQMPEIKIEKLPFLWIALVLIVAVILIYLSIIPFMGDYHYKNGKTLSGIRNFNASLDQYKKSLEWSPFESLVYTHLGISSLNYAQQMNGREDLLDETERIFRQGMQVDPYNADNYYILSKLYLMKAAVDHKYLKEAEKLALQALKIDPYYAETYQNLGFIYEQENKINLALTNFKKAASINPNLGISIAKIIELSEKTGKNEEALKFFEKYYAKYPWEMNLLGPQAELLLRQGKKKKAQQMLIKILEKESNSIRARLKLGEIYYDMGEINSAEALFQEVLFNDPRNITAHNGLGNIYYRKQKINLARSEFEQTLQLDPNNALAKDMLRKMGN